MTTHEPIVVIGSGLAGLTAARHVTGDSQPCRVLTSGAITGGAASMLAQGGIAAALDPDDSTALHAQDTWRAGAAAGDREVIRRITDVAPEVVHSLAGIGVRFDQRPDGELDLALEGGHSRPRVVHAGDRSGATITSTSANAASAWPDTEVLENHHVTELLTDEQGAISGVRVRTPEGSRVIETRRVILATGGLGGLWPHTTNPRTALGQGVALAARAGARTDDLHLVQFHPTGLDVPRDPMPLLTEALRGAGAVLLAGGVRFVDELQPRDVVAAAVWEQLMLDRTVYLDARGIPDVRTRFPEVTRLAGDCGLDLAGDLLPVRPALHYSMGGVTVDARSRTSVPGLWAAGEVSRTGLHGANRLASNSLLEAFVTGRVAASDASDWDGTWAPTVAPAEPATVVPRGVTSASAPMSLPAVRATLGAACGVLRDGPTLQAAVDAFEPHLGDDVAYVAWLIARSALAHPHSVGAHRRTDDVTEGAHV
ncbi:L-aspartate oxidase [Flexivirga caeni]|uniref:L-aspartate oxidase n=1 Tax=Flexivirga caeni TaxID=2294115 RepID=A0A3M9M4L6_9MICO|nr:FAD-binding protein [Flexivirga caeni]RNI20436.1 FAD-binding protein [Flexivirga caeni]